MYSRKCIPDPAGMSSFPWDRDRDPAQLYYLSNEGNVLNLKNIPISSNFLRPSDNTDLMPILY
jgi:hypothetical protein